MNSHRRKLGNQKTNLNSISSPCYLGVGRTGNYWNMSVRWTLLLGVLVVPLFYIRPLTDNKRRSSFDNIPVKEISHDNVGQTSGSGDWPTALLERDWWQSPAPLAMHCRKQDLTALRLANSKGTASCKIRFPPERMLPPKLCPQEATRILLLSFITTSMYAAQSWHSDPMQLLKNRLCYVALRGYRYVLEVIDTSKSKVPLKLYKPFLIKHYLSVTDWLVYLDFDFIVTKPHNWFEHYLTASNNLHDLILTDHPQNINDRVFMLKNSEWSRIFVTIWSELEEENVYSRGKYSLSDNRAFTEAVLRLGTLHLTSECRYNWDSCFIESQKMKRAKGGRVAYQISKRRAARKSVSEWAECVGNVTALAAGASRHTYSREMGRVLFIAVMLGFEAIGSKGSSIPVTERQPVTEEITRSSFYGENTFQSRDLKTKVPPTSMNCPQSQEITMFSVADSARMVTENSGRLSYDDTNRNVNIFKKEGAYMLSEKGICSLIDDINCQLDHFLLSSSSGCSKQKLKDFIGAHRMKKRKHFHQRVESKRKTTSFEDVSLALKPTDTQLCWNHVSEMQQFFSGRTPASEMIQFSPEGESTSKNMSLSSGEKKSSLLGRSRPQWLEDLTASDPDLIQFKNSREESESGEYDWWLFPDPKLVRCEDENRASTKGFHFTSVLEFYATTDLENNPRRRLSGFFDSYVNLRSNEDMKLEVGTENNVTDEKLRRSDLHVVKENEAAGMFFKPKHNCKILAPRTQKMPYQLCGTYTKHSTRILFVTVINANIDTKLRAKYLTHGSPTLALKNRACYVAARGHRYVIDVLDSTKSDLSYLKYKIQVVKQYLPYTDWLVYLSSNAIVRNPHNWMEQ